MTEPIPRILAIDDTPANLLTLGKALEHEFDLQIATSGAKGLALAEQAPPELILLDIMMPEMDGFEVCRQLKANPLLRDVPVVFVSALAEFETESQGLALGAADYITKPINVEIARQRIRNLIERDVLRKKANAQKDQLEKSYLEQKAMLENDLIGIVKTINRVIQWANPAFEKMMGYASGELIGVNTRQNYQSDQAYADVATAAYPITSKGGIYHARLEHVRKNGELIWVEVNGSMLNTATSESLWVFVDVTDRKRAEDELRQQLHFGAALNAVAKAIIDGNDRQSILQATTTIVGKALGLDRVLIYDVSFDTEVVKGLCEWLNPDHPDLQHSMGTYPLPVFRNGANALFDSRQPLISRADAVNPHLVADGSGQLLHEQMHIRSLLWYPFDFHEKTFNALALNQVYSDRPWTPQDLSFLQAVAHQVSIALTKISMLDAQAKATEALEQLAHFDALTQLPNRALLADRLRQGMAQEQRRRKKLAVVFVDLDGFKAVNDKHGHPIGDQMLISLATRMRQALREGDTLARWGGDEFVAVLGDLDNVNACAPMLKRLLDAAATPVVVQDVTLQVSASLGVTFYPQANDMDVEQLLRQADQAMYQAKEAGKNRFTYFALDSGL